MGRSNKIIMIRFIFICILIKNNNPIYFYISSNLRAKKSLYIIYGNVK